MITVLQITNITLWNADTPISGGNLEISVSYYFLSVYSETSDICTKTSCPIDAGDFEISHTQSLPSVTPPVSKIVYLLKKQETNNVFL